jgi:hypothetical protein
MLEPASGENAMTAKNRGPDRARARRRPSLLLPFLLLPLALPFAAPARADALDTVLDVLYKAGVVDGNVKAAKPLIECLSQGHEVPYCAGGSASQSELANDPQVRNVIEIYQAFSAQDWFLVLKKSGLTVGCALVPGGEVKDVACGELGKIAMAIADGIGSVLGGVGKFVAGIFGGGSDPDPMPEETYYQLNFMPWYHWSVVHQLDKDTPANVQVLNAPMAACVAYFDSHTYALATAQNACNNLRTRLGNTGYALGNAFRDETESYYQLHFAPKVDEWAAMSFDNDNINIYAKQAMNTCMADERAHLPLPNPGFDQCQAMKQSLDQLKGNGIPGFEQLAAQAYAQCQAQANQRAVPAGNDAYSRICQPMVNRIVTKVVFGAMAQLRKRMDAADAAGCPNSGTPKSVHCDTWATHAACEKALPQNASFCALAWDKAWRDGIAQVWARINTADAPCTALGDSQSRLACPHRVQQAHCREALQELRDSWGDPAVAGVSCENFEDPAYEALKQSANLVAAAINTSYDGSGQTQGCLLRRDDPLVIVCDAGFRWDADPQRAAAVYTQINAGNTGRPRPTYCLPDSDNDGAETPCIDGEPPEDLPPPVMQPATPVLQPAAPVLRMRPAAPVQGNGRG